MQYKSFLLLLAGFAGALHLLFSGCQNRSGDKPDFDRKTMLRFYADNLIRPAYAALLTETDKLKNASADFNAQPDANGLENLRLLWIEAYTAWQSANAYNFGPAGEEGLRKSLVEEIGTFPANTAKIEAFIAANDVSLNNFNRDTRGFLAIEYLLFNNSDLLLTDANRRNYLSAITGHLHDRVAEVNNAWSTYANGFVAADGTEVGSSTSLLFNEFVRSYEGIKNFKVGLPAGKRPGQTTAEPALAEAYYSGQSLAFLKKHLDAIEAIYYGRAATGVDSTGFREYLDFVVGGPQLIASTEAQWAKVKAAVDAVPTDKPLAELMAEGHPSIDTLHTELQKHTRFFKSDMSSLLGIAITFSSSDGD